MILLNLGCGGFRPPHLIPDGYVSEDPCPWINVDDLHSVLTNLEEPSRINLDGEDNYINQDLKLGLPFDNDYADGIVMGHFLEHLDAQACVTLLLECHRVLKPGGTVRISVPDAKKFYEMSVAEIAGEKVDWGQMCPHPEMTFMQWALFFFEHKQVLGIYGIFCMLLRVKFTEIHEVKFKESAVQGLADPDRSPEFSVFVEGRK